MGRFNPASHYKLLLCAAQAPLQVITALSLTLQVPALGPVQITLAVQYT